MYYQASQITITCSNLILQLLSETEEYSNIRFYDKDIDINKLLSSK